MLTKGVRKEIGAIAGKMPVTFYYVKEKKAVLGSVLIRKGQTEIDGKEIDPEAKYWVEYDRAYVVNHKRRLMKAYQESGKDGIVEYIKGQTDLHKPRTIDLHSRII